MRNPEQTRFKLVATATQLLLIKGPQGLRVDEVASVACVNKRMIYHYFGSKEGLHQAVVRSQVELLVDFADVLSLGVKTFLAEHFTAPTDKSALRKTPQNNNELTSGVKPSAANTKQSMQDAGLVILRALLDQRYFSVSLSSADWASLVQVSLSVFVLYLNGFHTTNWVLQKVFTAVGVTSVQQQQHSRFRPWL